MADWFVQIFIWYGLVTQFHQISCVRNSWSSIPTPQEGPFGQEPPKRNLQDNKKLLKHGNFIGSDDHNRSTRQNPSNPLHLTDDETWLNKYIIRKRGTGKIYNAPIIAAKLTTLNRSKSKRKSNFQTRRRAGLIPDVLSSRMKEELHTNETKYRRNVLTAQIPDDDIEDNGSTFSDEVSLKVLVEPPKSLKYFYKNNQKILVKNDWVETDNYYRDLNKHIDYDDGKDSSERHDNIDEHMEILLHKEDALEKSNDEGPTFKDRMTWVNMMRADRGWSPKETHSK